jgi:hypothetical protein
VVATICRGNRIFIFCPILSKLKLGLELKQKFHPETTISEQFQPNPANVKMDILSRLWNLRGWYSLVASVQGFCFNSQFFGLETSRRAVVSELNVWDVVSLKAGENCKSKLPTA